MKQHLLHIIILFLFIGTSFLGVPLGIAAQSTGGSPNDAVEEAEEALEDATQGGGMEGGGQEAAPNDAVEEETEVDREDMEASEDEDEDDLLERWRKTILYGIDAEVEELLPVLAQHGETRLSSEIEELLQSTPDPQLKSAIFEFFAQIDDEAATEEAAEVLSNYNSESPELVRSAISYLREGDFDLSDESLEAVRSIATSPRSGFTREAARVLGDKGGEEDASVLRDALSQSTDPEEMSEIVLAMGDLGSPETVEPLLEIAADGSATSMLRGYAADSLGRIGDPEAIDVLREMVSAEEALVRAYAVSALSRFENAEVEGILMSALRDSVARVRELALEGVARNGMSDALQAVIYKAEQDPDETVREQAFETLAQLPGSEGLTYVQDYVLDSDNSSKTRTAAASALIEHRLTDSIETLEELVEEEWDVSQSQLLGLVARELSSKEEPALSDLYKKFLSHEEPAVQIFGLRGIRTNAIGEMKEDVEEKTQEGAHPAVQQNAEAVLEQL